jgi:hydroxyacylglutathione hydrolase
MTSLRVMPFILGSYPIRGLLAWAPGEREAVFVDPGGWSEAIAETLAAQELRLTAILLTHGHWDHTEGLETMTARTGAPVYAHADDCRLLAQPPDVLLEGGETVTCGTVSWRVLHTPGHTAGSVCYAAGEVVFTGDTLFAGSIGGTPSADEYARERRRIRDVLFALGDATRAYPAHGPATTIGIERRCNPFLR